MDIRKIVVVGGLAVGAALTFAPLASADTPITTTIDSEITSLNSIFVSEVAVSGGPTSGVIITNGANTFDTTTLQYAPDSGTPTVLDYEVYGLNPIANASSDPGAYDVFNGALGEFDNAYNVLLYAAENGGNLVPLGDIGTDLIGTGDATAALGTDSVTGAVTSFLEAGVNDLTGYF